MSLSVRPASDADAAAIAGIYNHYVVHSTATFEELPATAREISDRVQAVVEQGLPWLVCVNEDAVQGYAYATRWRARAAYRHSVEVSVYVEEGATASGIGQSLYTDLFQRLRALGVHAVIGGITLPNAASVAFHEKFGMRKVAHFEQVGFKFQRWLDVGYWQLTLREKAPGQ